MAKSKLKRMAEAGDPWAIETLAKARALGRAAARRGTAMQRARPASPRPEREALYGGDAPPWEVEQIAPPKDPAFAEAMRDATDIREWTDGPKPAPWRVYRLAQALKNG